MSEEAFPIKLTLEDDTKHTVILTPFNSQIALFRKEPGADYLHLAFGEPERQTRLFEKIELITWIGGVALTKERERMLKGLNRINGDFDARFGFRPAVVIEDYTADEEYQEYMRYLTRDIQDDNLTIPEEFIE